MESIKSDPQFQNLIRAQNCPILPTTVCKTVRHMLSDGCPACLSVPSVLSVTLVYCG